ncbi:protein PHYTOCHROME KINASE SUBSTRATE 3-like [Humulus lupulus]|uniref:protein PHYTOCHROME KINASE SUBSTRATE 3-like n=1 Tax=Humulus lupulus TaxID=3486 RepID=UPI002B40FD7F|nr:protein PHYTOCHROME KINASE SUBSTRATE 3-like [Humulus lupulus]
MEVGAEYSHDDNNFRDASFSYLREESLVQKSMMNKNRKSSSTTDHRQEEGEICVFGAERYFNTPLEDAKTSNSNLNIKSRRSSSSSITRENHHHHQYGGERPGVALAPATPSAYSEASTWTSRSTAFLLRNSSRHHNNNNEKKKKKKTKRINDYGKSIFATLSCIGSCSGEKSVYVDHHHDLDRDHYNHHDDHHKELGSIREVAASKSDHHDYNHDGGTTTAVERSSKRSEDQFAFPILSSNNDKENTNNKVILDPEGEEPNRVSLEVFGSKTTTSKGRAHDDDDVATNLERKLSVLTWDAIPVKPGNHHHHNNKHISSVYNIEDSSYNLDSDASSDLFEIENITAASRSPPLETLTPPPPPPPSVLLLKPASRQRLGTNDNMSLHTTPNYTTTTTNNNQSQYYSSYEPSEASIEWSVVSASAAAADQVSSAVLGYDEKKLTAAAKSRATAGGGVKYYKAARRSSSSSGGFKEGRSRQNNGILGCKSRTAVRVAETVHRNVSSNN